MCDERVSAYARFRPPGGAAPDLSELGCSSSVQRSYRAVFGSGASNRDVYQQVAAPLVNAVVGSGLSACLICYGQSGSGKTHTCFGAGFAAADAAGVVRADALEVEESVLDTDDGFDIGVVPRALEQLFSALRAARRTHRYRVAVSFFEVYCETAVDLLGDASMSAPPTRLTVREVAPRQFRCPDLTVHVCDDAATALRHLRRGYYNRTVGCSIVHDKSSRSHAVFTVSVAMEDRTKPPHTETTLSQLSFVDLAGSEGLTDEFGAQQQSETKSINLSLFSLRQVVTDLADTTKRGNAAANDGAAVLHLRNSVLTQLLSGVLDRQTRIAVLCTCHTMSEFAPQSRATLKFGAIASTIEVRAQVKSLLRAARGPKIRAAHELNIATVNLPAAGAPTTAPAVGLVTERTTFNTRAGPVVGRIASSADSRQLMTANHKAPIVLCLQGFGGGCGIAEFPDVEGAFAPLGFRVVSIDFPGFGSTPGKRQTSRTERLWEDNGPMSVVVDVLEEITQRDRSLQVVLFGIDWGGNMALSLALNKAYCGRLAALVLIMPSWTMPVEHLAAVRTPTLLLWEPTDQLHLFASGKRMARTIPRSTLVALKGGADWSYDAIVRVSCREAITWLAGQGGMPVPRRASPPPPTRAPALPQGNNVSATADVDSDGDSTEEEADDDDYGDDDETVLSTQSSFLAHLLVDQATSFDAIAAAAARSGPRPRPKAADAAAALPAAISDDVASSCAKLAALVAADPELLRDVLLNRGGGAARGLRPTVLGALAGLSPILPFTRADWLVDTRLWAAAPRGWDQLASLNEYPVGRRVLVDCGQRIVDDFRSPDFGLAVRCATGGRRGFTYRAVVLATHATGVVVGVPWGDAAGRSPREASRLAWMNRENHAALRSLFHVFEVSWAPLRRWNDATRFPCLRAKPTTLVFDDGIQARYADFITFTKMTEFALAVADVARDIDFAGAIDELTKVAVEAPAASARDMPINDDVLRRQVECVCRIRRSIDMIHHVQRGKDPSRLCVADVGRLATYGQWHCHGMASVLAAALLPFSTALGIDVRIRDGFWSPPADDAQWDGAVRPAADHTWVEVTFFPSAVSAVCDPSFDRFEPIVLPLDAAYSVRGRRFPCRVFSQAAAEHSIGPSATCSAPHVGASGQVRGGFCLEATGGGHDVVCSSRTEL